jgi:hypothetical protein
MIQRQLYIYPLLVMSITLNMLQLSTAPAAKATTTAGVLKRLPGYAREIAVQEIPAQEFIYPASDVISPPTGESAREEYNIDVVMDYERHFLTIEEIVTYPNRTNTQLDSLTLAVAPNLSPNSFDLIRLAVDDISVTDYSLNGQRLDVSLPNTLEPDSIVKLTLRYTLSLPYLDQFNHINAPLFGYTDMQTNLVNWYPFVVPFADGEWVLHEPWWYGDYLEYPTADYKVNLVFVGEEESPVVAASGSAERIVDITRYTLEDGRAFAFSISPNFEMSSMKAGETTVSSYYLPAYRKSAEAAMETSAHAIELFSEKFGEYPHSSFSIVQAGLSDSREFSGLSFISRNFYQSYNGTFNNYLTYTAVHVTAHQWWFDQVGNDPAMEPWLDEALATFSEQLYFESIHRDLLSYWQKNRVDFFRPQGEIDTSIYESLNHDVYKQAVYFNGVYFLQNLRQRVGDDLFLAFLQDYYSQNKGGIATRKDFFRILDEHTDADYSDIINEYFKSK